MWLRKLPRILLKKTVVIEYMNFSTTAKFKEADINNIRNIGILAHIDAGMEQLNDNFTFKCFRFVVRFIVFKINSFYC